LDFCHACSFEEARAKKKEFFFFLHFSSLLAQKGPGNSRQSLILADSNVVGYDFQRSADI
jgi:hypothetical protein